MSKEVKNELKVLPDIGKKMLGNMVEQVSQFANIENTPLTNKEKAYASSIALGVITAVQNRDISWNQIDVKQVAEQVKAYSRLGLTLQDNEIYIDIRKNGKTGMQDVNIKKQYQGIEKEIVKWCSKKVVRFKKDVICDGDIFEVETDFETGLDKIVKHEKAKGVDRNDLKNITGAYQIAYIEENEKLVQYNVIIDRNRIDRALKASPTNEKPIWKADTQRMVLKTATWSLYNYVLKPFMSIPIELKADWDKTQDEMNFGSVEVVEETITEELDAKAVDTIDYDAETGEVQEESPEVKVTIKDNKEVEITDNIGEYEF